MWNFVFQVVLSKHGKIWFYFVIKIRDASINDIDEKKTVDKDNI